MTFQEFVERMKSFPFYSRIIAKGIDILIFILGLWILNMIFVLFGLAFAIVYLSMMDKLINERSVGKYLMGLHVVSTLDTSPVSLRASVLRNLPFIIGGILINLGLLGNLKFRKVEI